MIRSGAKPRSENEGLLIRFRDGLICLRFNALFFYLLLASIPSFVPILGECFFLRCFLFFYGNHYSLIIISQCFAVMRLLGRSLLREQSYHIEFKYYFFMQHQGEN